MRPLAGPERAAALPREIHANASGQPRWSRAAGDQQRRGLAGGAPEPPGENASTRSGLAVDAVGAPAACATAEATAMVLRLSGADASWPLHDSYGLPLERIPDVSQPTPSELIIRDLRTYVTGDTHLTQQRTGRDERQHRKI